MRTSSFSLNGKDSISLNPEERVTVTSFDVLLKEIELIPTPLLFLIGIISGIKLLIPFVFFKIFTCESPREYCRSRS